MSIFFRQPDKKVLALLLPGITDYVSRQDLFIRTNCNENIIKICSKSYEYTLNTKRMVRMFHGKNFVNFFTRYLETTCWIVRNI